MNIRCSEKRLAKKMSQIQVLTATGRSGSKRYLDQVIWVRTALVFGFCARLEQDMCITLRMVTSSNGCKPILERLTGNRL